MPKMMPGESYEAVNAVNGRKARAKIILLFDPMNYVHVKEASSSAIEF